MKSAKKGLLLTVCALALVIASVFGTLAYLTSEDTVTNTFTVGKVAITLDETDVDDSTPNAERDKANEYKLMPGHSYTKDPIVHVDSESEDCYLFVKVVNQIADIEGDNKVAAQMTANDWLPVEGVEDVYVHAKDGKLISVAGGTNVNVFETFSIAGSVDNATLAKYEGKTIVVTAYAIQADGFEGKTAAQIWSTAKF